MSTHTPNGFTSEDYSDLAKHIRLYANGHEAHFQATLQNNFNVILGALDTASSHAALVEALKGTISWLTSYPGGGAMNAYDKARAALKLAGEE